MDKENVGIIIGVLTFVLLLLQFLYVHVWSKQGISPEMKLSITNSVILILLFIIVIFPKDLFKKEQNKKL